MMKKATALIALIVLGVLAHLIWQDQPMENHSRMVKSEAVDTSGAKSNALTPARPSTIVMPSEMPIATPATPPITQTIVSADTLITTGDSTHETGTPASPYGFILNWENEPATPRPIKVDIYPVNSLGFPTQNVPLGSAEGDSSHLIELTIGQAGAYLIQVHWGQGVLDQRATLTEANPKGSLKIVLPSGVLQGTIRLPLDNDLYSPSQTMGQAALNVRIAKPGNLDVYTAALDVHGDFRIEGIPDGRYILSIPKKFFGRWIEINGDTHVDFTLHSGMIDGKVLDGLTKAPISSCQIFMQLADHSSLSEDLRSLPPQVLSFDERFMVKQDGTFEIRNLPQGTYRLTANGGGYGNNSIDVILSSATDKKHVEWELGRGASVNLKVTDQEGRLLHPIVCNIGSIMWGFQGGGSGISAGTFDVTVFSPGYALVVVRNKYLAPGSMTDLTFKLEKAVDTTLKVTTMSGKPLEGASVLISGANTHKVQQLSYAFMTYLQRGDTPLTTTGADGIVKVIALPAGEYPLKVTCKGYENLEATLVISPDKPEQTVTLKPKK